jgi:hypothetical protein
LERVEARLRRLETRLCKLMIHLGLDPQTNEPLGEPPAEPPKDYAHPPLGEAHTEPPKDYTRPPEGHYMSTFKLMPWFSPKGG